MKLLDPRKLEDEANRVLVILFSMLGTFLWLVSKPLGLLFTLFLVWRLFAISAALEKYRRRKDENP